MAQNIEIKSNIYNTEIGKVKLIACGNLCTFSEEALRQLSHGEDDTDLGAVVAYSLNGDNVTVACVSPTLSASDVFVYAASCVAAELWNGGRRLALWIELNGDRVIACRKENYTELSSPDVPYALFRH